MVTKCKVCGGKLNIVRSTQIKSSGSIVYDYECKDCSCKTTHIEHGGK